MSVENAVSASQSPLTPRTNAIMTPTPGSATSIPVGSDDQELGSASPESLNSSRIRKIACVECRQQKVKCDAQDKAPDACTRCVKRNLPCSIKRDFKRTYKRARLAAVEKEVEQLRRSLEVQNSEQDMVSRTLLDLARGQSSAESPAAMTVTSSQQFSPVGSSAAFYPTAAPASKESQSSVSTQCSPNAARFMQLQSTVQTSMTTPTDHPAVLPSPAQSDHISIPFDKQFSTTRQVVTPRCLEGFTVNREQIIGLFIEYETHYHPYMPVIDLSKGADYIFMKSDLLFWIILETASRIYSDVSLFPILSSKVKDLISRQLTIPFRSAYDVQATLIYTLWPPPAGSLNSDACWNACGLAMFNAVKLGLHCPGKTQDFGRVQIRPMYSETQEQVKTWVACNVVSQFLSMALGYPTFSMYDWTIINSMRPDGFAAIPDEMRTMIKLAKFCDRMVQLLNKDVRDICGNVDPPTRRSVIKILAKELDEMELSAGILTEMERLLISVVRTQLYAYAFLDDDFENITETLMLAYRSSIQTIAFVEMMDVSIMPDGNYSKLLYLPLYIELGIGLAGFIILKLQFSPMSEQLDTNLGKRHFASAIAIMRKASIKDNDFPIRVSTIMFQLWKLHAKDKLDASREGKTHYHSAKLRLRSRMATSVMFDSIWVWRERYGTFQTQPAGAGQGQNHPLQVQQQQQQQQQLLQQQQQQQQQQSQLPLSKIPSPKLQARREADGPELRDPRGVMELLDNTNPAYGPSFEQQNPPLPPAVENSMQIMPIPMNGSSGSGMQTSQNQDVLGMGTDELVNFLDNEAVAFDHLYLDWHEMGVLWDDMSMFIGEVNEPREHIDG
ncbi:hypothetical protein V1512DRAFT_23129 [Lipomyces arxii]|uniref:uncharacterized protein n=1 Tax=Lipomyces arxii TaxID=56418 RepID=UPI0034CF06BB